MRDYNSIPFRKPRKSATLSKSPGVSTPNNNSTTTPHKSPSTNSGYKQPSSIQAPKTRASPSFRGIDSSSARKETPSITATASTTTQTPQSSSSSSSLPTPHDSPLANNTTTTSISNGSHTSTAPSTRSVSPEFVPTALLMQQHQPDPASPLVDGSNHSQTNNSISQSNISSQSKVSRIPLPFALTSPSPQQQQQYQNARSNNATSISSPLRTSNTSSSHLSSSSPLRTSNASSSSHHSNTPPLSTTDALALRREGAESVIGRLRHDIMQYQSQYQSTKASLAKAEAVILELKSNAKHVKKQQHQQQQREPDNTTSLSSTNSTNVDARISDLQLQLDRAHAQLLTADMVRKELEDTLEAEQYTWELRVQDQERTIQACQAECATLADELQECRQQWKVQEKEWQMEMEREINKIKSSSVVAENNNGKYEDLQKKVAALEQERRELQACLDEALQELEAVDAELQGENGLDELRKQNEELSKQLESLVEPLLNLHRWLLERSGVEVSRQECNAKPLQLIQLIRQHLESQDVMPGDWKETKERVKELETQISVYRGDLQAKEESGLELRNSLKEAVALLKPLQDAVAKADREKSHLNDKIKRLELDTETLKQVKQELNDKEDELEDMKSKVQTLEIELSRLKLTSANQLAAQHRNIITSPLNTSRESLSKARQDLQAKRSAEKNLRQMLHNVAHRRAPLQEEEEEPSFGIGPSVDMEDFETLKSEVFTLKGQLAEKDVEMRDLQQELNDARATRDEGKLEELQSRVFELQGKLTRTNEELKDRKETERALNRSLKEALTLLRPLQMHLEEAEMEKKELEKEVSVLKKKLTNESSVYSKNFSLSERDNIRDLEDTVRELEKENAQLHDALEDMSHSLNLSHISAGTGLSQKNESRLREELVELKSRVEVTESRLENAYVENYTLAEALKRREVEERALMDELKLLKEQLKHSVASDNTAKTVPQGLVANQSQQSTKQFSPYADNDSDFNKP